MSRCTISIAVWFDGRRNVSSVCKGGVGRGGWVVALYEMINCGVLCLCHCITFV